MAASPRRKSARTIASEPAKPALRLARGDELGGASPVLEQQQRLEAAFAPPTEAPYPVAVKAALFIGLPTALWAGIIFAAAQVLR